MSTTTTRIITTALDKITTYTHDRKTSARLLLAIRDANRHRSFDWCVIQCIDQIRRDRR